MARYHFHTKDGRQVLDEDGTELASMGDARRAALRYLSDILRDDTGEFWTDGAFSITTTDDNGLVLFDLQLVGTDAPALKTTRPAS